MHRAGLRQLASHATATPLRSSCSSSLLSRTHSPLSSSSSSRLSQSSFKWSPQLYSKRWYSDKPAEEGKSEPAKGEVATEPSELEKAKADLEAKNKEVVDLKDKYLRSVADFRNLQERSKREQAQARDFAITRFAKDLVESIDNLDRAMEVVPQDKLNGDDVNTDLKNLHDGLKMTEQILMSTLGKHGLERFDPAAQAEKFDPNKHEAAFMTKMEDKEDGTVFHTMQKGFILNGRVIRAAKVGVVKNT